MYLLSGRRRSRPPVTPGGGGFGGDGGLTVSGLGVEGWILVLLLGLLHLHRPREDPYAHVVLVVVTGLLLLPL